MSYCRWSTDDFQCDLYCYEDYIGNFMTLVANYRRELPKNMPPPIPYMPETLDAWLERDRVVRKIVRQSPLIPIGLPHDGECFCDPDLSSFLDRLVQLKGVGYRFPDSVIEQVKAEIKAEENL